MIILVPGNVCLILPEDQLLALSAPVEIGDTAHTTRAGPNQSIKQPNKQSTNKSSSDWIDPISDNQLAVQFNKI